MGCLGAGIDGGILMEIVLTSRKCDECEVMSIVLSYTRKGFMSVMCPECGKVWEMRWK